MRIFKRITLAILMAMFIVPFAKSDSLAFSIGESLHSDDGNLYRITYQLELASDVFDLKRTIVEAYLDSSGSVWRHSGDEVFVVSVAPVLRFKPRYIRSDFVPFLDIGAGGPTYISNTKYADRNLDNHLQFENKIGVGFEYGNKAFSINALHYSNSRSGENNDGTDWIVGTFSFDF